MIHGNHTIKVGGEFSNLFASQTFGFNQTGVYTFAGIANAAILDNISPLQDLSNANVNLRYYGRFDTTLSRYNQQVGNLQAAFTVKEYSFFGQDSWPFNR